MGIVYLALDVRLDRPVALKVLPTHLAKNEDLRERFLHEARTAAKLSHPNIVPIYSVGEVGDFVYFAMAYVAGESLGDRIRRRGPMSPSDCTRLLREVGFALSYAHAQGVIHRDIKPDNILLEEGTGRALVADFGIAGIMNDSDAIDGGEIIGTVEFMSPEQAFGRRVDQRSDIYSLGMVAYYALSGNLPFTEGSIPETLKQVQNTPVPPVGALVKTAPRRLSRLIDTCLKKVPDERFDSADALAEALDVVSTTHKQIPIAVRNFLYDPIDLGGDGKTYYATAPVALLPLVTLISIEPQAGYVLWPFIAFAISAPGFLIPPRVRRLISSGNTVADLAIAVKQDLEERKEEFSDQPVSKLARFKARLRSLSAAAAGGSWTAHWITIASLFTLGPGGIPPAYDIFLT